MDYAPNVRFCEVAIDGEYMGLYVMTESITEGNGGSRLTLSADKKDNTFSGYVLRLDRGTASPIKNIETFSSYALRTKMELNIEYPGVSNLTEKLADSISKDFSAFEKALYSYDFNSYEFGYKKLIDVENFVDYFIINEATCNYDAGWLSTYIYKATDGKMRLCVWDFNSACGGYEEDIPIDQIQMQNCIWYIMLVKDEDFTEDIVKRYYELRESFLSDEYLERYINETVEYLGPAIERNFEKWGYTFLPEEDIYMPEERNPRDYDEAISFMEDYLFERLEWLDENIETVKQYSADSKVKKFNEHTD